MFFPLVVEQRVGSPKRRIALLALEHPLVVRCRALAGPPVARQVAVCVRAPENLATCALDGVLSGVGCGIKKAHGCRSAGAGAGTDTGIRTGTCRGDVFRNVILGCEWACAFFSFDAV